MRYSFAEFPAPASSGWHCGIKDVMRWIGSRTLLAMLMVAGIVSFIPTSAGAQSATPTDDLGGVTETTNILFRTIDDDNLFLDAYVPPPGQGDRHPAVVAIHGGGFARGFRTRMRQTCIYFAQHGYSCFTVDYRLAPNYDEVQPGEVVPVKPRIDGPGYPAQIEDIKAAVEFIRGHAREFEVDPVRIGTLGASAGGTLSLMMGAESKQSHSQGWEVAASASWSGAVSFSVQAEATLGQELEPGSNHALYTYVFGQPSADVNGSDDGDPSVPDLKEIERADPYTHATNNSAPAFLGNSENELVPVDMPESYATELDQLGVPNQLDVFPGRQHALGLLPKARQPTLEFFEEHVRGFSGTFTPTEPTATPTESPPTTGAPSPSESIRDRPAGGSIPVVPIAIILVIGAGAVGAMVWSRARSRRHYRW